MKRHHLIAATLVSAGLGIATAASADCAAELDALGVSKDGTTAPLAEAGATPQTGGMAAAPDASAGGVAKDGTNMPLGENADVAMSAEDAQAQSQGGQTAAAQAAGAEGSGEGGKQAAIREARAALASGDEAACMAAVQKAKAM